MYPLHPKFAQDPEHYVRAFKLIQKDLFEVFEYVEPADTNLKCYSFRVHEMLMRVCIELEANFKAILVENGYSRLGDWNRNDYKKIEKSHLLSGYEVRVPNWRGRMHTFQPFAAWSPSPSAQTTLTWYDAYNNTKHDRHAQFQDANFENLLGAISGLVVVLGAQFYTNDFGSGGAAILMEGPASDFETAIGDHFLIKFPNWPANEQYDFDWQTLGSDPDPFQQHTY